MDKDKLIKRIRTIELQTNKLTSDIFAGNFNSAFKGRGMSFSEVRSYQIGDDLRTFDWNVTARMREPHVKVFEEEKELSVFLVIDVSASMFFGKTEDSKIELAAELLATIGFSAAKRNDKVGAVFVSDQIEFFIPPKKGLAHIYFLIEKLIAFKPVSKQTNLDAALASTQKLIKQRGVCIVISDFLQQNLTKNEFQKLAKKHDVIAFQVYDKGEMELPSVGYIQWYNTETGQKNWIDSSSSAVRKEYQLQFEQEMEKIGHFFLQNNLNFARFETGNPIYPVLKSFFASRK